MIEFDKIVSILNKLQCDLIKAESRCMEEYCRTLNFKKNKSAFERYCDNIAYLLFDTAKEIIEAKYQDFNKVENEND